MIPALDDWVITVHGHHMMGAGLLQGGSSVLGLAIVAALVAYALRRGRPTPVVSRALTQTQRRSWVVGFILVVVVCTVGFDFLVTDDELPFNSVRAQTHNLAIAFLRGLFLAVLIVSFVLNRYLRYRGSGNASTSEV
jgi:membrane protease YdiL (CAAX protease family)